MERDELLKKLKQEGYDSALDYCLKNWEKLNHREQNILRAAGIEPGK